MTNVNPHNEISYKTCVIASDLKEAEIPKREVVRELEKFQYADSGIFAIKLALEEALCNAIKHGNQCDPSKKITVRYSVTPECVTICIRDEGEGFTPEDVPDPTTPDRLRMPSGRGIMLLRAYMDKVEYRDNGREIFFMRKRRHDDES